jgi:asparagine synthase (glutamine-hydrolysing)
VKVALSGVGGDELFSGYPRHLGAKLSGVIPRALAPSAAKVFKLFPSRPTSRDVGGWIRRFGEALELEPQKQYWSWTTFLNSRTRSMVFASPADPAPSFVEETARTFAEAPGSFLDKILRVDLSRYLSSDLLKFGDNMTMANSLELRVPFSDVDLVEEVARTPAAVRFPGYRLKPVLREIARDLLPTQIANRRKQGFMVPIGNWFRKPLRSYVRSGLAADKLPPFLSPDGVRQLVNEHLEGSHNHTHLLWAALVLTRWLALHPAVKIPDGHVG